MQIFDVLMSSITKYYDMFSHIKMNNKNRQIYKIRLEETILVFSCETAEKYIYKDITKI